MFSKVVQDRIERGMVRRLEHFLTLNTDQQWNKQKDTEYTRSRYWSKTVFHKQQKSIYYIIKGEYENAELTLAKLADGSVTYQLTFSRMYRMVSAGQAFPKYTKHKNIVSALRRAVKIKYKELNGICHGE